MVLLVDFINDLINNISSYRALAISFSETANKSLAEFFGETGDEDGTVSDWIAIKLATQIKNTSHRLMYCNIIDEDGNSYENWDDFLYSETWYEINLIIKHNLVGLASSLKTYDTLTNSSNGITHNQTAANPNRNSSVMIRDNVNFNNFDIQNQQNKLAEQALIPFINLREELLQFVDFQKW